MRTLFIAWQDPVTRSWHPIGRLSNNGTMYRFVYLHGAREAAQMHGFEPLASFPLFEEVYESFDLWPLFMNRLLSPSRPDYADFVSYLGLPERTDDPMAILARSGGRRATDALEMYPLPNPENDKYHIHFFAHGLSHFSESTLERINKSEPGEHLLLLRDFQNAINPGALLLRTNDQHEGDRHLVGWLPDYMLEDVSIILERPSSELRVEVERVNRPPAPLQMRLLCILTACWPQGFQPFSSAEYEPIVDELVYENQKANGK